MATCPSKLTKCNLCLLYHAPAQLPNAIICKRSTYANLINKKNKKNYSTLALLYNRCTDGSRQRGPSSVMEGSMGPFFSPPSFYC